MADTPEPQCETETPHLGERFRAALTAVAVNHAGAVASALTGTPTTSVEEATDGEEQPA